MMNPDPAPRTTGTAYPGSTPGGTGWPRGPTGAPAARVSIDTTAGETRFTIGAKELGASPATAAAGGSDTGPPSEACGASGRSQPAASARAETAATNRQRRMGMNRPLPSGSVPAPDCSS